jgi:hypothetical protein
MKEITTIKGGWDTGYCQRLLISFQCHHPNRVRCDFGIWIKYRPCEEPS